MHQLLTALLCWFSAPHCQARQSFRIRTGLGTQTQAFWGGRALSVQAPLGSLAKPGPYQHSPHIWFQNSRARSCCNPGHTASWGLSWGSHSGLPQCPVLEMYYEGGLCIDVPSTLELGLLCENEALPRVHHICVALTLGPKFLRGLPELTPSPSLEKALKLSGRNGPSSGSWQDDCHSTCCAQ